MILEEAAREEIADETTAGTGEGRVEMTATGEGGYIVDKEGGAAIDDG